LTYLDYVNNLTYEYIHKNDFLHIDQIKEEFKYLFPGDYTLDYIHENNLLTIKFEFLDIEEQTKFCLQYG
jgi:hypothetical protein